MAACAQASPLSAAISGPALALSDDRAEGTLMMMRPSAESREPRLEARPAAAENETATIFVVEQFGSEPSAPAGRFESRRRQVNLSTR